MEEKILFKCKHCDNDDIRYFIFNSLEYQSEQYANSPYRQNWNRETTPKIPVGIHIKCGKCNKDTFIIPTEYQPTLWGADIPEQCIINIKYQQPEYSAIQYVLTEDGFLDQIVITANNDTISLLSKEKITKINYNSIGQKQYQMLLERGLPEIRDKNVIENEIEKINQNKNINRDKDNKK